MLRGESPPSLAVHIGLPKCASTSLQRFFANTSGNYCYLGKFERDGQNLAYKEFAVEKLVRQQIPFALEMDFNYAGAAGILQRYAERLGAEDRALLLSEELLSGFGFAAYHRQRFVDPALILARLKQLFPRVAVLLVVREQFSWLRSYYSELVMQGLNLSFSAFVQRQATDSGGLLSVLRYGTFWRWLQANVDKAWLVPFESLIARDEYALTVMEGFGTPYDRTLPRERVSPALQDIAARLLQNVERPTSLGERQPAADVRNTRNWLSGADLVRNPDRLFELDGAVTQAMASAFAAENRLLGDAIGVNLGRYNYLV